MEAISGVRDIILFPRHRWLVVVATDHGIYRSFNCGEKWEKCADLQVDRFIRMMPIQIKSMQFHLMAFF